MLFLFSFLSLFFFCVHLLINPFASYSSDISACETNVENINAMKIHTFIAHKMRKRKKKLNKVWVQATKRRNKIKERHTHTHIHVKQQVKQQFCSINTIICIHTRHNSMGLMQISFHIKFGVNVASKLFKIALD